MRYEYTATMQAAAALVAAHKAAGRMAYAIEQHAGRVEVRSW